ncbi:choice-of-anchor L domain-containing protein [Cellvibrio fontiphilus]|uniref:Choice-of-anchor L domain-containing protein n=1 Tax=Cellvibrio fontiphilus TaxID=1815559 RepID=A0ABV7FCN0_9GAMM
MKTSLVAAGFIATLALSSAANALVVTPENSGSTLANTILGSGISISNVNYTGANGASGTFTNGNSAGLSIDKGIVLSTGQATNAMGTNNTSSAGTSNGTAGYAPLTAIAGFNTYDATRLKFDFEFNGGTGGDLFFNFVFGSEEYLEYVGTQFNDVFGFFVDGVNVALTPGSNDPITINTINTTQNSSLFVNNTPATYSTQMDGFTKSLQITLKGLSAGLHSMEFAIADAGDSVLDSWIFVEAKSFADTPVGVSEPSSLTLLGLMLMALGWSRRKAAK